MTCNEIGHQLGCALVGHVRNVDPGCAFETFHGEVVGGAVTCRTVIQFTRLLLRQGNQLLGGFGGSGWMGDEECCRVFKDSPVLAMYERLGFERVAHENFLITLRCSVNINEPNRFIERKGKRLAPFGYQRFPIS